MKKNSLLLLIVFACNLVMAQTAATNTGTLYITGSSDIFYAAGNFTNNSGSALSNNGQLYIKGNLSNSQSSMAIGTGTLYLNGSSAQAVNGSQPFNTWHLNTNNSSGITLNNSLSISGTHTFVNGVIATSATPNYLIYESGSSYSGDGDTKHVNGWVKKFGSSNFTFPVGNGTIERTAGITNLSASSEINGKYIQPTANIYNLQGPIVQVQDKEYWQIDKISGGTAQITLNWDNSRVPFPPTVVSDIRVANYTTSLWMNNGGTGSGNYLTTGTVTSNAVSTFGPFTFGFVSVPLPLSLISFTAQRKTNYTGITWTTAHEQNADHFTVERSNDAVRFYAVAQKTARNSGNIEVYSVNDYESINNIAYYRLKSVDSDGKEKLSSIVSVTATNTSLLALLANPVHDKLMLSANSQLNGVFNYSIHSIHGQLIQEGSLVIQNGGQYSITLNGIPEPGTYALEVSNGLQRFHYKIMIR